MDKLAVIVGWAMMLAGGRFQSFALQLIGGLLLFVGVALVACKHRVR